MATQDDHRQALYLMADEMRGFATATRHFATNPYDEERAARMMEMAIELAALADDEHSVDDVRAIFETEPWHRFGPLPTVDTFILNHAGQVLLIQRSDTRLWAMPGGVNEINHTPAQTAVKELWEEAGIRATAQRLLGVFDNRLWGSRTVAHLLTFVFAMTWHGDTPSVGSETIDVGWFDRGELPPLHPGHTLRLPRCFELMESGATYFDPADYNAVRLEAFQRSIGRVRDDNDSLTPPATP